jgi:hypothetical protein
MPRPPLPGLLGAALCILGCSEFPRPTIPQVENTRKMVEGQGDRFAAHRACVKAEPELDSVLQCMRMSGYTFLVRGPEYPSTECWQIRDRGGADLPPAHCWDPMGANTPR